MSNRRRPAPGIGRVESTGIKIEARHRHHSPLPVAAGGEHLWIVMGVWRVVDPTSPRFDLDVENLLTIDGPGCLHCELPYALVAALPCPGEPPGGP